MDEQASDEQLAERVCAQGHENVSGEHESTFEFTSDDFLTPAGDCILGIEADRTPADFDPAFVAACQEQGASIEIAIATENHETTVQALGYPDLTCESDRSMVVRTSDHVDDRTVAVAASAAAADIDRELVDALASGAAITMTLTVE